MQKNDYLSLLGIERWCLREAPAQLGYYRIELKDRESPVGVILADVVENSDEEAQLVLAIAKSTNKTTAPGLQRVDEIQLSHSYRAIILLGERVAQLILQSAESIEQMQDRDHSIENGPVVVSYSPAELLKNKNLKAATWKAIQKAIKFLQ